MTIGEARHLCMVRVMSVSMTCHVTIPSAKGNFDVNGDAQDDWDLLNIPPSNAVDLRFSLLGDFVII